MNGPIEVVFNDEKEQVLIRKNGSGGTAKISLTKPQAQSLAKSIVAKWGME